MALQASPGGPAVGRPSLVFDLSEGASGANLLLLSNLQRQQQVGLVQQHHQKLQQHLPGGPRAAVAAPPHALGGGAGAPPPPRTQCGEQQQGSAVRLNEHLQSLESRGSLRSAVLGLDTASGGDAVPLSTASAEASLCSRLGRFALRFSDMMQPTGEAPGDTTWGERTANVLTSLPFLALGWHMHRQRLTPEGKHHALSMVVVGTAATLYHATSGTTRRLARKVDYWTIAYTSSAMTKSLFADTPGMRRAANLSLLALPFRPFAVSMGHALVMQAEFARQAAQHKVVRVDLRRHYTAALLGVAAFFGEDLVMDTGYAGFVHSAWHCLAAYSMYTVNGLLAHKERQLLQRQLAGQAGAGGAKPLRRPVHSSASSLPSYGSGCSAKRGGWSPGTASP